MPASARHPFTESQEVGIGARIRIDTAGVYLFRELYLREHGEWLGEEAPHSIPKIEARLAGSAAA